MRFLCLHVDDHEQLKTLRRGLARRFDSENVHGLVATLASPQSVRRRLLRESTVVEWLSENSGLPPDEAVSVIAGFPIRVAPLMCQNAWNPLMFLGLAAAIAKSPAVLVYMTVGMDPSGKSSIYDYARARLPDGCLIHTSPSILATACPSDAQCAVVRFAST